MKSVPLKAYPRTQSRRGGAKKLRAAGRMPAVIYGRQAKPQNLEVNAKELERSHPPFRLGKRAGGSVRRKRRARPNASRSCRKSSTTRSNGKVLHVDFHEVAENEKVIVQVPRGNHRRSGRREDRRRRARTRSVQAQGPRPAQGFARADHRGREPSRTRQGHSPRRNQGARRASKFLATKTSRSSSVAMPRTEEEEAAATHQPRRWPRATSR